MPPFHSGGAAPRSAPAAIIAMPRVWQTARKKLRHLRVPDMPDRITLSRTKGWKMPPNTVKVDRSTIWGNPWRLEEFYRPGYNTTADAQIEAVRRFRAALAGFYLNGSHCPPRAHPASRIGRILRHLPELRGKNLACWCKPGTPCHADVLLELANA